MRIVILILISVLLTFCENQNKVEVIPDYDEIYLLPSKVETKTEILGDEEEKISEILNIVEGNYKPSNEAYYFFETVMYIDELGNVNKLKFIKRESNQSFSNSEINPHIDKLFNTLSSYFTNLKFLPATRNGLNVKSQYKLEASFRVNKEGKAEVFLGALQMKGLKHIANLSPDDFYSSVEEMPMPIGGINALASKVRYPEIAKRAGIEGKVFVKAFIDENGYVVGTEIIKGIGGGCDQAAMNAVTDTKFNPGKKNGIPVKVQVSIPIMFKLN